MANLRYQLSWQYQITLLYSHTDAAPQFLYKLTSWGSLTPKKIFWNDETNEDWASCGCISDKKWPSLIGEKFIPVVNWEPTCIRWILESPEQRNMINTKSVVWPNLAYMATKGDVLGNKFFWDVRDNFKMPKLSNNVSFSLVIVQSLVWARQPAFTPKHQYTFSSYCSQYIS